MKKLLLIVLLSGFLFIGCENEGIYKRWPKGTLVKMKVDGRKGMITGYNGWFLILRVGTVELVTRTRLLSNDESVQMFPYSYIEVREFEIEKLD